MMLAVAAAHSNHHLRKGHAHDAHVLAANHTEDPLAAHEGVQGKITYHGYDQDWHTEYKGDIHAPSGSQKEAFAKGYLHNEYPRTNKGPYPPNAAGILALGVVALLA